MSDIFVSYDDLDRSRVRELVESLEAHGWSVWWDHRIATGDAFAHVIERELEVALCVIVAWTDTSVDSHWVRAEANEAWKRGKLVPVLLDPVTPPMPFGQIQAADLVDWSQPGHPGFAKLLADLEARIGRAPVRAERRTPAAWLSRQRLAMGGGAALLMVIAAAFYVVSQRPPADGAAAEATTAGGGVPSVAAGPFPAAAAADAAGADRRLGSAAVRGHWQAPVTYPDGAGFEERFNFEVTAGLLSGSASLRGYGNPRGILNGTVDGNRISFRTRGQIQTDLFTVRDVTYLYQGLLEGDTIRFSVVEEGTGDPAFGFVSHRISAEQANRIATGGRRPRLGGLSTNGLYRSDHIRDLVASGQSAMTSCYEAAEYDEVSHEFVSYDLTLDADGGVEQVAMLPRVPSLDACMREVLARTEWGPTDTGAGGTMQINISARLPWNP